VRRHLVTALAVTAAATAAVPLAVAPAVSTAQAAAPATAQAAAPGGAPTAIDARGFTLTTDTASLAGAVSAVHEALGSRRRTVGQLMATANRPREPLCNRSAYTPLTDRSSVIGFCWNGGDDAVDYWYPQGITTTRDALEAGEYDGHQLVATSWYHEPAKEGAGVPNKGVRLAFADWDADHPDTYRHVLLVEPTVTDGRGSFRPVPIHAGGIAWYGNLLYVADTTRGFRVFDVNRIYAVDGGAGIGRQPDGTYQAFGYGFAMLQIGWVRNTGTSLRYSFTALDRASTPDSLVVGEYAPDADNDGAPDAPARVVRYPLDAADRLPRREADGRTHGSEAYRTPFPQLQGVVARNGRFWFASSNGQGSGPAGHYGTLRVWDRGTASVRSHRWAYGPEDLSYWPDPDGADYLWTLTEYPNHRAVVAVPQASFD
jgi:hypothetical protein